MDPHDISEKTRKYKTIIDMIVVQTSSGVHNLFEYDIHFNKYIYSSNWIAISFFADLRQIMLPWGLQFSICSCESRLWSSSYCWDMPKEAVSWLSFLRKTFHMSQRIPYAVAKTPRSFKYLFWDGRIKISVNYFGNVVT